FSTFEKKVQKLATDFGRRAKAHPNERVRARLDTTRQLQERGDVSVRCFERGMSPFNEGTGVLSPEVVLGQKITRLIQFAELDRLPQTIAREVEVATKFGCGSEA